MTVGEIAEFSLKILVSVLAALVLIYRPAWPDKLVGKVIRITPTRGKLFGALILLGSVFDLGWTVLMGSPPGNLFWRMSKFCGNIAENPSCHVWSIVSSAFLFFAVLMGLVLWTRPR